MLSHPAYSTVLSKSCVSHIFIKNESKTKNYGIRPDYQCPAVNFFTTFSGTGHAEEWTKARYP